MIERHPFAAVALGALAANVLWELAAHLFLVACGATGAGSWSWWAQSLAAMLP